MPTLIGLTVKEIPVTYVNIDKIGGSKNFFTNRVYLTHIKYEKKIEK